MSTYEQFRSKENKIKQKKVKLMEKNGRNLSNESKMQNCFKIFEAEIRES